MPPARPQVGPHDVEIEHNVMHIRFRGPYVVDEARQFLQLCDELFRTHGAVYILTDVKNTAPPGPETRRILATWPYLGEYVSAIYGVGAVQRAVMLLTASVHRLLGVTTTAPLYRMFATEAEARQFIDQHRSRQSKPQ